MLDWVPQLRNKPKLDSRSYVFTQTPGGSLAIGSNTITLAPVPLGVNAANTQHRLYISGGTGAAEVVIITGGTAVAGQASGTLTFTCANTHSGAWTIGSATFGIQEAVYATGGWGAVQIPPYSSAITVQGPITVPGSYRVSIRGSGINHTVIQLPAADQTDDIFIYAAGSAGYIDFGDMTLAAGSNAFQTGGAMLSASNRTYGVISNLSIQFAFDGIELTYCNGGVKLHSLDINANRYGVHHSGTQTQAVITNSVIHGAISGLRIDGTGQTVGYYVSNCLIDASGPNSNNTSAAISFHMNGQPVNEVVIAGCDLEAVGSSIEFIGDGTYRNNSLTITGCRMLSSYYGVQMQSKINGVMITGCSINVQTGTAIAGILASDVQNLDIHCNHFACQGASQFAIQAGGTTSQNWAISGNDTSESPTLTNAIQLVNGMANVNIDESNDFSNVTTPVAVGTGTNIKLNLAGSYTFGNIPSAAGLAQGSTANVTDSTTAVWGATITGTGANKVRAYHNGTNWTVMGK